MPKAIPHSRKRKTVWAARSEKVQRRHAHAVATIEDVFDLVYKSLAGFDISGSKKLDGRFDFFIRITGEQWTGKLDFRVALFILNLQKEINLVYSKASDSNVTLKNLLSQYNELVLSISVITGSTRVRAYLEKCLKNIAKLLDGMESKDKKHTLVAFAAIAGLSVCFGFGTYHHFKNQAEVAISRIRSNEKIELAKIEADKDKERDKIVKEAIHICETGIIETGKLAHEITVLAREMRGNDRLYVGRHEYTRNDVLNSFPQIEPEESRDIDEAFLIDGEYDITSVNLENGSITIKGDNKKYSVITKFLPDKQKRYLHGLYRDCELKNTYPKKVALQINAIFTDGQWIGGQVVGVGKSRKGSISIREALKKTEPRAGQIHKQASLLE